MLTKLLIASLFLLFIPKTSGVLAPFTEAIHGLNQTDRNQIDQVLRNQNSTKAQIKQTIDDVLNRQNQTIAQQLRSERDRLQQQYDQKRQQRLSNATDEVRRLDDQLQAIRNNDALTRQQTCEQIQQLTRNATRQALRQLQIKPHKCKFATRGLQGTTRPLWRRTTRQGFGRFTYPTRRRTYSTPYPRRTFNHTEPLNLGAYSDFNNHYNRSQNWPPRSTTLNPFNRRSNTRFPFQPFYPNQPNNQQYNQSRYQNWPFRRNSSNPFNRPFESNGSTRHPFDSFNPHRSNNHNSQNQSSFQNWPFRPYSTTPSPSTTFNPFNRPLSSSSSTRLPFPPFNPLQSNNHQFPTFYNFTQPNPFQINPVYQTPPPIGTVG